MMKTDTTIRRDEIKARLRELRTEQLANYKDGGYTHQRWDRIRGNLYRQNELKAELAALDAAVTNHA